MEPIRHPSNNMELLPPPGVSEEECQTLYATSGSVDGRRVVWSFWKPTPEELAALNEGKPVVFGVWGDKHPPVYLGVEA